MSSIYSKLERPPLAADALRRDLLKPGSLWTGIEVVDETASTNAELARRASGGAQSGLVFLAEHQTAGRGRLDRAWVAPPRAGVTMSVLIRPYDVHAARWSWIPLMTGLAVAAAVRKETGVAASLKWPNDVIVDDRKLAGVLVERINGGAPSTAAVIGIGLNVSLREDELPVANATSLALVGAATTDRMILVKSILRSLEGVLTDWQRRAGDATEGLQTAYVEACATIGRWVRIELPSAEAATGKAVGVDASGRLLLETADGQAAFGAGDVVHIRSAT